MKLRVSECKLNQVKKRKISRISTSDNSNKQKRKIFIKNNRYEEEDKENLLPSPKSQLKKNLEDISRKAGDAGCFSPQKNALNALSLATTIAHELINSTPVKKNTLSSLHNSEYKGPLDLLSGMSKEQTQDEAIFSKLSKTTWKSLTESFVIRFPSGEVTVCNTFYQSGKKASVIPSVKSYPKIAKILKAHLKKFQLTDSDVAKWCFNIMRSEEIKDAKLTEHPQNEEVIKFLSKVCSLIYGAEGQRSKGLLITHSMFLDLVIVGKYKLSDITELPLSFKGAMSGVRFLDDLFSDEIPQYRKYDFPQEVSCVKEAVVTEILSRNFDITKAWLKLKGINLPNTAIDAVTLKKAVLLIGKSIESWYSVHLRSLDAMDEDHSQNDALISSNASEMEGVVPLGDSDYCSE